MALRISTTKDGSVKTFVSIREIKIHREEGKKTRATFKAVFNSNYKNSNGEYVDDKPLFVSSGVSFSEGVIKTLEGKEKAFGTMSGKLYTESFEKDGEKVSFAKLQIDFFTEIVKGDKAASVEDEEVPF